MNHHLVLQQHHSYMLLGQYNQRLALSSLLLVFRKEQKNLAS
jgi:hypothetical protein